MGKNDAVITCRLSPKMKRAIDSLASSFGETASRSDVIVHLLQAYMAAPQTVSPLDVLELREPVEGPVLISLPPSLYESVCGVAAQEGTSLSSAVRMALYVELCRRGVF